MSLNGVSVSGADQEAAGNRIAWRSQHGINGADGEALGNLATVSLAYDTRGVRMAQDPDHPGWLLLEHENGEKTAFGLGESSLDLVGDSTFARTLYGTAAGDTLEAPAVADAAAGVPGIFIDGQDGDDTLTGSAADDVLTGGKGNDRSPAAAATT